MDQEEKPLDRRRGRPRKWATEADRREHEAAKRRLRNKAGMTSDEFTDVRRLTELADDLQRQIEALTKELQDLRQENQWLHHEHARVRDRTQLRPPERPKTASLIDLDVLPAMNRAKRREAERRQRRSR